MCLCVNSVPIVLNCEKTCLLGNAAVIAEDQGGRKMGQRLKIQCACAQVRLRTKCVYAAKCVFYMQVCLQVCGLLASRSKDREVLSTRVRRGEEEQESAS